MGCVTSPCYFHGDQSKSLHGWIGNRSYDYWQMRKNPPFAGGHWYSVLKPKKNDHLYSIRYESQRQRQRQRQKNPGGVLDRLWDGVRSLNWYQILNWNPDVGGSFDWSIQHLPKTLLGLNTFPSTYILRAHGSLAGHFIWNPATSEQKYIPISKLRCQLEVCIYIYINICIYVCVCGACTYQYIYIHILYRCVYICMYLHLKRICYQAKPSYQDLITGGKMPGNSTKSCSMAMDLLSLRYSSRSFEEFWWLWQEVTRAW